MLDSIWHLGLLKSSMLGTPSIIEHSVCARVQALLNSIVNFPVPETGFTKFIKNVYKTFGADLNKFSLSKLIKGTPSSI